MKITIFNTGKSDCILIDIDNKFVLIDTALDRTKEFIYNELLKMNVKQLECLILSHHDKDHIGGADKIINNIKINKIFMPRYVKPSKDYFELLNAINDNKLKPIFLRENKHININGADIIIFPPFKEEYKKSNNYQLIVSIHYENYSFLFMGDAQKKRLKEFLSYNKEQFDFVKMPHHGKFNSKTEEFINNILPKYALITCSKIKMSMEETISCLNKIGARTFLSMNGQVEIECNKEKFEIRQK